MHPKVPPWFAVSEVRDFGSKCYGFRVDAACVAQLLLSLWWWRWGWYLQWPCYIDKKNNYNKNNNSNSIVWEENLAKTKTT